MPTFTVVPVEDADDGSNSASAAEASKPISLGKIFGEDSDKDNVQGRHTGRKTGRLVNMTLSSGCKKGFLFGSLPQHAMWQSQALIMQIHDG